MQMNQTKLAFVHVIGADLQGGDSQSLGFEKKVELLLLLATFVLKDLIVLHSVSTNGCSSKRRENDQIMSLLSKFTKDNYIDVNENINLFFNTHSNLAMKDSFHNLQYC